MKTCLTQQFRVASFLAAAVLSPLLAARAADQAILIPQLLMQAKAAVTALPKMEDRAHALCKIARVQAAAGDLNGALGTIESIRQLRLTGEFDFTIICGMGLAEIAGVQVRRGDAHGADAVAKRVDDGLMKSEVYASIASAQVENGDLDGALQTAKRVSGEQDHFMPLRAPAFAQIGRAYVKRGDLDAAERVLEADRDNKSARAMAIKGGVKSAIVEQKARRGLAKELLHSARASTNSFSREGIGSTVALTLADMGEFPDAFAALELVSTPHWREDLLGRIAAAQARHGDDNSATETVSRIPSPYGQAMGWKAVANAYIGKGEREKARRVLEQIQPCHARGIDDSRPKEFCGAFAEEFVDLGDFAQAKTAISIISDTSQRWNVLCGIVRRLAVAHDFEHAREFVDLASTDTHRMRLYTSIAAGMELSGASEDALRFTEKNVGPSYRDRTMVEIAKIRTRRGRAQDALVLVSEITDRQAKVDALVGVAESLLPARFREDDLLSEADALEKPLDSE
jgi:tetratricopeptide (TPR) repeat protein